MTCIAVNFCGERVENEEEEGGGGEGERGGEERKLGSLVVLTPK